MELGYLSPIFLREKKGKNSRLMLNLKELNKFVPHHDFKIANLKYDKEKVFHSIN